MADYWKSQPRKFCQYCKCWIADNKPSVEFHERGKNHKENVAAKISEIKKKSVEKAKQDARMCKQFAAMEEAALKAYEEDLKRMERESSGSYSPAQASSPAQVSAPVQATSTSRPQPQPQPRPQAQRKSQPKKQQRKTGKARQQTEMPVWIEGVTDDGQLYYYNTVTGESQWDKPAGVEGESSAPAQSEQTESSGSAWMEAVSPDGFTYYYNTETGESSWEKPADVASNEASGGTSGSNIEEGEEDEDQEEPLAPEPEPLSGGEESSDGAPASQEAAVPEQASQQPKVPKISFRKRKAEAEPSEKEGDDKAGDGSPSENDDKDAKKEEEVQSSVVGPEKTEEGVTQGAGQAKKPKTANPYGVWEQIKEEEDPYAKVDLQLPQVEEAASSAPGDLPPEPKPKFRERIITSLGEEGGPASFKKNKTQNSRSRSLRQRDNDD